MISRFADTAYYLALINPADVAHQQAAKCTVGYDGVIITTSAVINELGNHLRQPVDRALFVETARQLQHDRDVRLIHVDEALLEAGIQFFERRPDQEWSLTDCISFVVMQREGLHEALTTDHHFEQTGFTVLLKT